MNEIETPKPITPPSPWLVALTCSVLVLVLAAGGMLAMRDRLLADASDVAATQTTAREKLAERLDGLQRSVDSISTQPQTDGEALAAITTKIADLSTKLDALNARVDEMAKKPEPIAQAPALPAAAPAIAAPNPTPIEAANTPSLTSLKLAILSGKPFAAELATWAKQHPEAAKQTFALASIAESGLMSEADLNRKLRATLDDAAASKKIDDTSLAGKINTHLAGLISIKKAGQVNVYDTLRKNVLRDDITTLILAVEALDTAARKPLEPWLTEARTRRDALDALAKLDAGSGY
jgi:hypothetical protein